MMLNTLMKKWFIFLVMAHATTTILTALALRTLMHMWRYIESHIHRLPIHIGRAAYACAELGIDLV